MPQNKEKFYYRVRKHSYQDHWWIGKHNRVPIGGLLGWFRYDGTISRDATQYGKFKTMREAVQKLKVFVGPIKLLSKSSNERIYVDNTQSVDE